MKCFWCIQGLLQNKSHRDDVLMYSFKGNLHFLVSHPLSFQEEFIITLFYLAGIQEKQLFVERLFSQDIIYLPYSEGKITISSIYSFLYIHIKKMLFLFL